VVLSAATLPNYGLKSVDELVKKAFPRAVVVENELLHMASPQLRQRWIGKLPGSGAALGQLGDLLVGEMVAAKAPAATGNDGAGGVAGGGDGAMERTMVFCNTAAGCAEAAAALAERGLPVAAYHKEVGVWLCHDTGSGAITRGAARGICQ